MDGNQQPAGSAGAIGAASVASVEEGFSRLEAAQEAARQLEADCLEIKRRAVAQLSELELQVFAAEVRAEEAEAQAADARACLTAVADAVAAQLAPVGEPIADLVLRRAA